MKKAYSIREYRDGDEKGILELTEAVYGKVADEAQWLKLWRWMYDDNPAGKARIYLAEHNGRIISQRTVIPLRMKIGEKITKGSQNVNLMTHPAYRNQGLFSALEELNLKKLEATGIEITYSFPSPLSYPGYMKFGWIDIYPTLSLIKLFKPKNVVARYVSNSFLSKIGAIAAKYVAIFFHRGRKV